MCVCVYVCVYETQLDQPYLAVIKLLYSQKFFSQKMDHWLFVNKGRNVPVVTVPLLSFINSVGHNVIDDCKNLFLSNFSSTVNALEHRLMCPELCLYVCPFIPVGVYRYI